MPPDQFTVTIEMSISVEDFARAMLAFSSRFRQAARVHCGCPWCQGVAAGMQMQSAETLPAMARASLERDILAKATHAEIQVVRDTLARGALGWNAADCVIAVIARTRGLDYSTIPMRAGPFEGWLYQLPYGATPATNRIAQQLDQWLAEWQEAHPPMPAEPTPEVPIELESGLLRDLMFYSRYAITTDSAAVERTEAERWLRREPLGFARIEV